MRDKRLDDIAVVVLVGIAGSLIGLAAMAQRDERAPAAPGSPAATTTIDDKQLPPPDPKFEGVIREDALQSKAWWPPRVVPPKGAPNVLLIMTDDVGFGAPSTFGGVIPTPALDRVAKAGLRYTQFHSTALCSPTRAALITGRNHHSTGFGVVAEQSTGFPGYDSLIPKNTATIARTLQANGYATSWFGKNHNTPTFQASQVGPFDRWPIGLGFDYFYGFLGGDTNQWEPAVFRQTTPIHPNVGKPGWNLVTAMTDEAIAWLDEVNAIDPDKPFFCYFVPGATHAPHHPTKEWVDRIHAMHLFDGGWNQLRETIFANQKRMGLLPVEARLTPWPDQLLKKWDTLRPEEKTLFIRQAEVYAAYLAYADHEIGRVIQAVEDLGKLDNTLIIYISGDNGASAEGTPTGTPNEIAALNGIDVPIDVQAKLAPVWGTDKTYNHMAVGWAWAFDTPFSWTKQIASHFGGTRQGMAVSWPAHLKDAGGLRAQFHHVVDVVPTILEAAGLRAPDTVDGIKQRPIEGTSFAYTFDRANARVASRHHTQYFEMMGDHAIYHDGWIASTKVTRVPWQTVSAVNPDPFNNVTWELYDLTKDFTQSEDVAAKFPAKVSQLKALFATEARRYQVLPLDASVATRAVAPRPSLTAGRTEFTYTRPITGIPIGDAPSILNASFTITASLDVPQNGAEGVIVTTGGRFGGYGLYLVQGRPVFTYNFVDLERPKWAATQPLGAGRHTVEFDFKYEGLGTGTLAYNDASGIGRGGTGVLKVDGRAVASQRIAHTVPVIFAFDETFDVGSDTGTPVDDRDYKIPFALTAKLLGLRIAIDRPRLSPEDQRRLQQQGQRNNRASE